MQGINTYSKVAMGTGCALIVAGLFPLGFGANFIHNSNSTNVTLPVNSSNDLERGIILCATGGATAVVGGLLLLTGFLMHKCCVKAGVNDTTSLLRNAGYAGRGDGTDSRTVDFSASTLGDGLSLEERNAQIKEKQKMTSHTLVVRTENRGALENGSGTWTEDGSTIISEGYGMPTANKTRDSQSLQALEPDTPAVSGEASVEHPPSEKN